MKIFFSALLALLPLASPAQTLFCGLTTADLASRQQHLQTLLATVPTAGPRAVQYVPLRFHLVANSAGEKRMAKSRVLDLLCLLNADFAAGDIQFYLHEDAAGNLFGESLASDLVFEQALSNAAVIAMTAAQDEAAINIFIVDEIALPNQPAGNTEVQFSVAHNWIVATRSAAQANGYVISHELGHYFSLLHPSHGWALPFGPNSPGWPLAPATVNGNPVELMDGSNCLVAGDLICDTPPDYLFALLQPDCAPYTGGALDPAGQAVDPMENNLMGYFWSCGDYVFTPGQFAVMNAELASANQDNLDNNFVPTATEILTPPDLLVSPPPSFFFPSNTNIQLDWLDVAGATHYLVQVDLVPTFTTPAALSFVTTATELILPQPLLPDHNYRWRVRPFNAYVGCAQASLIAEFRTGPATTAVPTLSSGALVQVAPNPVAAGGQVWLYWALPQPAEAEVMVFDPVGRHLHTEKGLVTTGSTAWPLSTEHWPAGVNWLQIRVNNQIIMERIVKL